MAQVVIEITGNEAKAAKAYSNLLQKDADFANSAIRNAAKVTEVHRKLTEVDIKYVETLGKVKSADTDLANTSKRNGAELGRVKVKLTEEQKKLSESIRTGIRIVQQSADAQEKLRIKMEHVTKAYMNGKINADQYNTTIGKLQTKLNDTHVQANAGIMKYAAGWTTLGLNIATVTASMDDHLKKMDDLTNKIKNIGGSQAEASTQFADLAPEDQNKVWAKSRELSVKYGVKDIGQLNNSMANAYSASGGDLGKATESVEASVKLARQTPQSIDVLAGAALDIGSAVPKWNAKESLAFLLNSSISSRVKSTRELAENLAPTINAGVNSAKGQDPEQAAIDTGSLFNSASQAFKDVHGRESGTASSDILVHMQKFYREEVGSLEQSKAELSELEKKQRSTRKFDKATGTMGDSLSDTETKRLGFLKETVARGIVDPGGIDSRIDQMAANPFLREKFLEHPFGSALAQSFTRELLTEGSTTKAGYEQNRLSLNADTKVYDQAVVSATSNTIEQRLTDSMHKVEAKAQDKELSNYNQTNAAIYNIGNTALENTRRPGFMGYALDYAGEFVGNRVSNLAETPDPRTLGAFMTERLDYRSRDFDRIYGPNDKRTIEAKEVIETSKAEIRKSVKDYEVNNGDTRSTIHNVPAQGEQAIRLMEQQNRLVEEQNRKLDQLNRNLEQRNAPVVPAKEVSYQSWRDPSILAMDPNEQRRNAAMGAGASNITDNAGRLRNARFS